MREIKFRGKRKDNGEWVYGYYAPTYLFEKDGEINNTYAILSDDIIGRAEMFGCGVSSGLPAKFIIKEETLGQYTGLKDKNGKKIFEGDIILVSKIAPAKVFYNEENACYAFDYGKNGKPFVIDLITDTSLEVIGNIYDNPELLGE